MAEYIDRVLILQQLERTKTNAQTVFINSVLQGLLQRAPAADVVEVVHGRWIDPEDDDGGTTWYCNKCGIPAKTNWGTPYGNYCPNCGATMDLKE